MNSKSSNSMANPSNQGDYGQYDYKHDCPRPLTGCDYPRCSCDVDDDTTSHKEEQAIESIEEQMEERDYEDIDPEDYTNE
ncbi:hypothetical protein M199_gp192 [Halogranum tailed virus 1]|uniref:Uncharacterized protein n=1 Tax=Halogranum tailed virus 1 TaxID=1273749 RepID=R4T6Z2_9CAUD|nr:hypothetical protein M199_gp192 [Halogranum tailed virus 1]AGM11474.1 hypothetical protein HGTV1_177 [Halogranum tailed virus 1]